MLEGNDVLRELALAAHDFDDECCTLGGDDEVGDVPPCQQGVRLMNAARKFVAAESKALADRYYGG